MRLLKNAFSTAETTMAGTTAGAGGVGSSGTYGAGKGFKIQRITAFCGGTTVAPNTSGGISLQYGESSDYITSTMVVLPYPCGSDISSQNQGGPVSVTLDGLDIRCNWFQALTHEAAPGGWGIFVIGE
jgi:hypothetical protein